MTSGGAPAVLAALSRYLDYNTTAEKEKPRRGDGGGFKWR